MPRFLFLLACVFGLAALMVDSARAEYDSGGTPTNPAQAQANRPQAYNKDRVMQRLNLQNGGVAVSLESVPADPQELMKLIKLIEELQPINPTPGPGIDPADPQELIKLIQAMKELQPVAPKPAPAKKPVPKLHSTPRPVIPRS